MSEQLLTIGTPAGDALPPQPDRAHDRYLKLRSIGAAGLLLVVAGCGAAEATTGRPDTLSAQVEKATFDPASLTYDDDPEIIQFHDPLPNPQGDRKIIPKGITLHWWAFESGGDMDVFRRGITANTACGPTGCSVQYAITKTGQIYRMMESPLEMAYHAHGANPTTIGIEMEGVPEDFSLEVTKFNEPMFKAVVSLSAELVEDFGLPIEGEVVCEDVSGIHGHHEYNGHCGNSSDHKPDVGDEYTQAVIAGVKSMQ